ncbi:hypothetical protein [Pseudomonas viridiflava]|uniref:hypothetical protein n=1 Tax=Pseudomonas viridiflava TaxID=33069 RepID=UPI001F11F3EE|nr:hypothetical protein [Pseudomonas viridiflava]
MKSFGASLKDLTFYRLPSMIERARIAVPDTDIVGYLICALERPPQMTGLLFCDRRRLLPEGLPVHTPAISDRFWKQGYEVVVAVDGGCYVVAHWLCENGALDRFDRVH